MVVSCVGIQLGVLCACSSDFRVYPKSNLLNEKYNQPMKKSYLFCLILVILIEIIGCSKNNAAEENFGYCFAYHQVVKKDEKSLSNIFQPIYLKMNTELGMQFAERWIQEYYMAQNESIKQSLIINARKGCRSLNIPD